jgi:uncharacterized protein
MTITERNCFYPDPFPYYHPAQDGLKTDEFFIDEVIHCWLIHPEKLSETPATVVHLHGNAENMTSHALGSLFFLQMGFNLVTFDYRGYGRSPGNPSLVGIQEDALSVFGHIFSNQQIFGADIFGFGQSMGGFTLGRVLPQIPALKGAIFDCALHSFRALFMEGYPMYACDVPDISALVTLPLSSVPKLFIHGTSDEVVPFSHSEKMFEVAAPPKELMLIEGVSHIGSISSPHAEEYMDRIRDFINSCRA